MPTAYSERYAECKKEIEWLGYSVEDVVNAMDMVIFSHLGTSKLMELQQEFASCVMHMMLIVGEDANKLMDKYEIYNEDDRKELLNIVGKHMDKASDLSRTDLWED